MFFYISLLKAIVPLFDNDSYDIHEPYDLDEEMGYNTPSTTSEMLNDNTVLNTTQDFQPLNVKIPKNAFRSIRYGKIKTNPENLETLIQHEMEDISPDLHNKIRKRLAKSNVDRSRYKDLFFIKKRIIQDGDRKIVSFDIKEKIIPKNPDSEHINKDVSLRVILAGILFLLAGLVFTTTMKMYQNIFKKNVFNYDGKKEQNKESI